jgi:hypothetical protein
VLQLLNLEAIKQRIKVEVKLLSSLAKIFLLACTGKEQQACFQK